MPALCQVCGAKRAHVRTSPVYRLGEPVVLCGECQHERKDNPFYLEPNPGPTARGDMARKKGSPAKLGVLLDNRYSPPPLTGGIPWAVPGE